MAKQIRVELYRQSTHYSELLVGRIDDLIVRLAQWRELAPPEFQDVVQLNTELSRYDGDVDVVVEYWRNETEEEEAARDAAEAERQRLEAEAQARTIEEAGILQMARTNKLHLLIHLCNEFGFEVVRKGG